MPIYSSRTWRARREAFAPRLLQENSLLSTTAAIASANDALLIKLLTIGFSHFYMAIITYLLPTLAQGLKNFAFTLRFIEAIISSFSR